MKISRTMTGIAMAALCAGVMHSAFAADAPVITAENGRVQTAVTNSGQEEMSATLYAAAYDEAGGLVSVKLSSGRVAPGGESRLEVELPEGDKVVAFLWDGSGRPLAEAKEVEEQGMISDARSLTPVKRARLADLGWSQFVVAEFESDCDPSEYVISVDGTDVTAAVTPVTTDGHILKWEITSPDPAELTVTDSRSGNTQQIKLSDNISPQTPAVRENTAPGYMIAHGPMAVWDYYLSVYDDDGAVRIEPSETTIDISDDPVTGVPAYYSPDAEIDENGSGTVEIMFNYNQPWEQEWFDSIENKSGSVQLVSYDENRSTVNDSLVFTAKADVEHYGGRVGEIFIKTGQSNFTSNGRYYVRVRSEGHSTVLVPIHVVNKKAPTMKVTAASDIRSGDDVTFVIEDMVYGITNPTYAAELTLPDGTVKELELISDWYQIGSYLYLYNSVDANDIDRNKLIYKGVYTITVHSNGFKDMRASFYVSDGEEPPVKEEFDMVSSATSVSTGGTSGSGSAGGAQMVSADVKFNADLLINAIIISEQLDIENEAARGIANRWRSMTPDSVSAADTKKGGFTWSDYYSAVMQARIDGSYLCFADYAAQNADKEKETIPYSVKSVLENNLLGDIQYSGAWVGKECPRLYLMRQDGEGAWNEVSRVAEGEDISLISYDTEYLAALRSVNLNGNSADLIKGEDYELKLSTDGKMMLLSIHPKTQSLILNRSNTIRLEADGYRENILPIYCEKDMEQDIYLTTDKDEYTRGDDVVITVENSQGEYVSYLAEIEVGAPSGKTRRVLSAGMGGTSSYYYTASGNVITVTDSISTLFDENGEYTITLKPAEYYNAVSVKINVVSPAETEPEPQEILSAPGVSGITYHEQFFGDNYYRIAFEVTGADLKPYIDAITSVTVGGTVYEKTYSFWNSAAKWKTASDDAYGTLLGIDITPDGVAASGTTDITVEADGYESQTFSIKI